MKCKECGCKDFNCDNCGEHHKTASVSDSPELTGYSANLVWSKEPPRLAGWYWTEDHHGITRVQHVVSDPQDMRRMTILENTFCGWRHKDVVNMGIKWAGPIPRPTAL